MVPCGAYVYRVKIRHIPIAQYQNSLGTCLDIRASSYSCPSAENTYCASVIIKGGVIVGVKKVDVMEARQEHWGDRADWPRPDSREGSILD